MRAGIAVEHQARRSLSISKGDDSMLVKITPNDKGNPVGTLADAELHFDDKDGICRA
jgi:hypothetical protein